MHITMSDSFCTAVPCCDTAVYAAFFMEGLRDQDYDAVIQSWDQGCIELVSAVVAYTPLLRRLVDAAVKAHDDSVSFPGVFEYEVCSPFGMWIGGQVLERADMPTEQACREWLAAAVIDFFIQSGNAACVAAIRAAVDLAKTRHQGA